MTRNTVCCACVCCLRTTEKLTQDFLHGVGKRLHDELVVQNKENKHTSYISGRNTQLAGEDSRLGFPFASGTFLVLVLHCLSLVAIN